MDRIASAITVSNARTPNARCARVRPKRAHGAASKTPQTTSAASVPEDQPIDALTDEQRADWCDWFATAHIGDGFPEPASVAPDQNGYSITQGCSLGWEFMCQAMIPTISSSNCEANLRLSTCTAAISELTDCVTTVHDTCWPSPHGCARYLERPGCDGTIAIRNVLADLDESPPGGGRDQLGELCSIRIQ